ncbi:unnamed protein product [Urochloa humidicola]
MSIPFPPGINFPPIDFPPITLPPPSPVYWRPPPPPRNNDNATIAGFVISFGVVFVVISCACMCSKNRENAEANGTEPAAVLVARPRAPLSSVPSRPPEPWYHDYGEQQLRRPRSDGNEERQRPPRVSPAAGLLSFPYNRSVRHNVGGGGGGEEEASCSVCLGVFQTGETVRLLPVCLHLFHVECIDPWLDMHSTCPICRSDTDPTTDGRL